MRLRHTLGILCATGLAISAAAIAVQPATAPTTRSTRPRAVRLTSPWNKVADLTDDQKGQINAIHEEVMDKIHALEKEEDDRCEAILSGEQQKALAETLSKEAAEKKAKAGKKA